MGRLAALCPENAVSLFPAFLAEKTADDVQMGMDVMEKSGYASVGYQKIGLTEAAVWFRVGGFAAFVLAGIFLAMQYRGQRKRLQELRIMGEYLAGDWMKPPEFSQPEYGYLRQCALQGTARLQKEKAANEREKQELAKYLENISHQIKTPLAGVSLCQEYLESVETDEEKKRMLKESQKQIESIRSLVLQLLQKARLDAGRASMKLERVTLARLMERVKQTVRYLSVERGVRFEWQYEPEQQLLCDCFWVQEALINLIKNAAENTPDGGCVEIIVSRKESRTDFEVRDSGPGRQDLYLQMTLYGALCGLSVFLLVIILSGISKVSRQYQQERLRIYEDLGMKRSWRAALQLSENALLAVLAEGLVSLGLSVWYTWKINHRFAEAGLMERIPFGLNVGFELSVYFVFCAAAFLLSMAATGGFTRRKRLES